MDRRNFLKTVAVSILVPTLLISITTSYKSVEVISGRITSVGTLNQQFLQKRHLAKMWMFAKNYGSSKEAFIKNLERIDAEPIAMYRKYKGLFKTEFKEIELLAVERSQKCREHVEIVQRRGVTIVG